MNTDFQPEGDEVRGRVLRFLITRELERAARPLTVKELISCLEGYGFTIRGRSSKTVSDCLRWEIGKGRVRRLGRGIYEFGYAPRSTLRRVRRLAQVAQTWVVALTRSHSQDSTLDRPKPWHDYRWLWRL